MILEDGKITAACRIASAGCDFWEDYYGGFIKFGAESGIRVL